jgi:hypothetical protein
MRYWTPEDIFDVRCPECGRSLEFCKDEPLRLCPACRCEVRNPRIDLGCAQWCAFAAECLGKRHEAVAADPLVERFKVKVRKALADDADAYRAALDVLLQAERFLGPEGGNPCLVKMAALLAGANLSGKKVSPAIAAEMDLQPAFLRDDLADIVQALAGGHPCDRIEYRIVHDSVQLQRLAIALEGQQDTDDIVAALLTLTGKLLAAKRVAGRDRSTRP